MGSKKFVGACHASCVDLDVRKLVHQSFSIVRTNSVYNAWKFRYLSNAHVFRESDITIEEVAEKYVEWSILADVPDFLGC